MDGCSCIALAFPESTCTWTPVFLRRSAQIRNWCLSSMILMPRRNPSRDKSLSRHVTVKRNAEMPNRNNDLPFLAAYSYRARGASSRGYVTLYTLVNVYAQPC